MIILLPLPHKNLQPNKAYGQHWSKTYHLKSQAKNEGFLATLEAIQDQGKLIEKDCYELRITFFHADNRKHDRDNMLSACKSALDGVASALGIDDNRFEPIVLMRSKLKNHNCVKFEVI